MDNKKYFIDVIDYCLDDVECLKNENGGVFTEEVLNKAIAYFNEFKNGEVKTSGGMTENGSKVLAWMQENEEKMSNLFTSKEIAEALFTSGRSVAGSMRKLVKDEYVEKVGTNPIKYALTEAGRTYKI